MHVQIWWTYQGFYSKKSYSSHLAKSVVNAQELCYLIAYTRMLFNLFMENS